MKQTTTRCLQCQARHLKYGTISQLYQKCATCAFGQQVHEIDHKKWNGHVPSSHK